VVIAEGEQVVATGQDGTLWARDLEGKQLWESELPRQVRPGNPEQLTVDGGQVIVTLAPPPNTQLEPDTVDVVAFAL
jgi:hypothetical protein